MPKINSFDSVLANIYLSPEERAKREAAYEEERRAKEERLKTATSTADIVTNWYRAINAYDVERIFERVAPRVASLLAAVPDGPERELLVELHALVMLLGGVAAEGSRNASHVAMSIPDIRVEYPR